MRLKGSFIWGVCLFVLSIQAQSLSSSLHPKREFRAAWIQTVHGHFRDMPTRQLQDTLLVMLDSLRQVGMNAVIFQVRPEADTFYSSELEPWSRFLTGEQGKKPEPEWDPMRFMIEECHRRAMEFHAWINPYRVKISWMMNWHLHTSIIGIQSGLLFTVTNFFLIQRCLKVASIYVGLWVIL